MHKYQVSSATVLPIATDDVAGKTESLSIPPDRVSRSKSHKSVIGQQDQSPRLPSSSNTGVAFTPHAQKLDPIDGGQGQEPDVNALAPAPDPSTDAKDAVSSLPKQSATPLRRMSAATDGAKKPQRVQRKRSQSLQPTEKIALTKNYEQLVREFNALRPFTRCPDGSYPRDTKCVICRRAKPSAVFFPCQHRCVCDDCVASHRISADRSSPSNWCACPVCMADICLILAHSGQEEEKYWKWVMEVQPRLSTQFKSEFKMTARRLEKGATTASVSLESEATNRLDSGNLVARRHTWQQPHPSTSGRRSLRGDGGRLTCSIL